MKFCRYGPQNEEKPALIDEDGVILDLSDHMPDLIDSALDLNTLSNLAVLDLDTLPDVDPSVRLGPPVAGTGKFICIGLNYTDHAEESRMTVPEEPVIFMKATSAITGPNDPRELSRGSDRTDWEVELGVVIGRTAKYVSEQDALDYVAGNCTVHDVSEHSFRLDRPGQWTKGKSADTFGPIGPWLVTKDEVPKPQALDMWLSVNGERMQNGSTQTMVYGVAYLVHYLSQFMSLRPGDIISTGIPPGVGMGLKLARYLSVGDVVELKVSGLGQQRQTVRQG